MGLPTKWIIGVLDYFRGIAGAFYIGRSAVAGALGIYENKRPELRRRIRFTKNDECRLSPRYKFYSTISNVHGCR